MGPPLEIPVMREVEIPNQEFVRPKPAPKSAKGEKFRLNCGLYPVSRAKFKLACASSRSFLSFSFCGENSELDTDPIWIEWLFFIG